jgi:hypothetical protein
MSPRRLREPEFPELTDELGVPGLPDDVSAPSSAGGMSAGQARALERSIIGLCLVSLALIFQPFSLTLFGIGAGLVVVAGLAFNLIPLCRPGVPVRSVVKTVLIVLTVLVLVVLLAITAAKLYALYLQAG